MKIFDTHAHYDDDQYKDDLDAVLSDNFKSGVKKIVNASFSIESSINSQKLSEKYENIYYAVGIHPEEIREDLKEDMEKLEGIVKNAIGKTKLVAIGEIGLDYHYTKENKEEQKKYFIAQLDIAIKYNLPIIVHSRDAAYDTYTILSDEKYEKLNVVFHCFQPDENILKLVQKRDYMVGLGGNITYKRNEQSINIIEAVPQNKLLVETDAPYMSPVPLRGTRNESKNIKYVIEKLAEIKKIDIESLQDVLYENSIRFFRIKEP